MAASKVECWNNKGKKTFEGHLPDGGGWVGIQNGGEEFVWFSELGKDGKTDYLSIRLSGAKDGQIRVEEKQTVTIDYPNTGSKIIATYLGRKGKGGK